MYILIVSCQKRVESGLFCFGERLIPFSVLTVATCMYWNRNADFCDQPSTLTYPATINGMSKRHSNHVSPHVIRMKNLPQRNEITEIGIFFPSHGPRFDACAIKRTGHKPPRSWRRYSIITFTAAAHAYVQN